MKKIKLLSHKSKGSILIGLIITMVLLSSIGVTMVDLNSASTFSQLNTYGASRAYFLAEAGYRYAASRYLNAADESAKLTELKNLDSASDFILANNDGKFKINIDPYFFRTTGSSTAGVLRTELPGSFPSDLSFSSGKIMVGSAVYDYNSVSQSGSNVNFTISGTMSPIPSADITVLPVAVAVAQTVTKGNDLTFTAGSAEGFPKLNGSFTLNNKTYSYKEKNSSSNKLTNIQNAFDSSMDPVVLAANTNITLQKFVKMKSTGKVTQISDEQTSEITYYVPIGQITTTAGVSEFTDDFNNLDNWFAPTFGALAIVSSDGSNALKVSTLEHEASGVDKSLMGLDWSTTNVNFDDTWQTAGNLLSYDVQVKVKADNQDSHMAGISFRLDSAGNCYGVSYLKVGSSSSGNGIPDTMEPAAKKYMIVLWQYRADISARQWVAYKILHIPNHTLAGFFDDMENGTSKWTLDSPWGLSSSRYNSVTNSLTESPVGNSPSGTVYAYTNTIDFSQTSSVSLSFYQWYDLDFGDNIYVQMQTPSTSWSTIASFSGNQTSWEQRYYLINSNLPSLNVQFRLKLSRGLLGADDGWNVDDFEAAYFKNWTTLLVRVLEAYPLSFINGGASGTPAIKYGDTISQGASTAKVAGTPILSSGSWGSGNAQGILTLSHISGTFTSGTAIKVSGVTSAVTGSSLNPATDSKYNYIRVYYSDTDSHGTPSSNQLDDDRLSNPRDSVNWAPHDALDTDASNDFFTLVQWDSVTFSGNSTIDQVLGTGEENNAVIRTDNRITTDTSGTFAASEVGLHTYGTNTTTVYFDDFAVQTVSGASGQGFQSSVQR